MEQVVEYPRYDSYMDSGVEWLGEIPSHWEFKKNKYIFTEQKETVGRDAAKHTLLSLTLKGIIARDMVNPQGKFPAEFNTYKIIKPNDLIFCLFDIEETPRTIGRAHQDGMITGAYTVMECSSAASSNYLSYYYLSLDYDKKLKPLYTGLRKVIQRDTFMSIKSPLPPIDEQDRIANFLDKKTAEIDDTIAKKQRLIELLKEQKSILINQAVTKGLNPDAPMRDSGVEWIGEVPEHWEVKPNRFIFRETTERSDHGDEVHLSMSQKFGLVPAKELSVLTLQSESYEGAKLCCKGDLVLNRLKAHLAVFSTAPCDGLVSPDYSVFKLLNSDYEPTYFESLFKTPQYLTEFNKRVRGIVIGFYRLYSGDFKAIPCLLPPAKEQVKIMRRVTGITQYVVKVQKNIEKEIETMKELRAVLISEAVTGKIKL